MDVDTSPFESNFFDVCPSIKDVERRPDAVLCSAPDDCPTVDGTCKLLDAMEGVLHRPPVREAPE